MKIEDIRNSQVHIIPSFACNLHCPHCDQIHKQSKYIWNEEKFFDVLNKVDKSNSVLFFGGEPLLNKKELIWKILDTNKINSMTTNILLLSEEYLLKLIEKKVRLGTSWNPQRMTDDQYNIWLSKIQMVKSHGQYLEVFITVTDDLFDNIPRFLNVLDDIDKLKVDTLALSMVVPCNPELVKKADNLFCWLEDHWRWHFALKTKHSNLTESESARYGCRNRVFTLYPDGTLDPHCAHNDVEFHWNGYPECKDCIFKPVCAPCPAQPCCHFLKNHFIKCAHKEFMKHYGPYYGKKLRPEQMPF